MNQSLLIEKMALQIKPSNNLIVCFGLIIIIKCHSTRLLVVCECRIEKRSKRSFADRFVYKMYLHHAILRSLLLRHRRINHNLMK